MESGRKWKLRRVLLLCADARVAGDTPGGTGLNTKRVIHVVPMNEARLSHLPFWGPS